MARAVLPIGTSKLECFSMARLLKTFGNEALLIGDRPTININMTGQKRLKWNKHSSLFVQSPSGKVKRKNNIFNVFKLF